MTLPSSPEYRPRSRGLIIAAIAICTRACRPPRPRPWSTRQAMSVSTDCESPASIEPTMKMMMASWSSSFLLNRSESLPQIGRGRRRGQQGGRDDPRVLALRAAQVGDDRGQGVGDDRPRQERHEHRQHHPGQRREDLAVRHAPLLLDGGLEGRPVDGAGHASPGLLRGAFVRGGRNGAARLTGGPPAVPGGPAGAPGRPPRCRPGGGRAGRSAGGRRARSSRRARPAPSRRAWRGSRRAPRRPAR